MIIDADHFTYTFIKKLIALQYIDELWLYGSRGRGDYGERSDIDLAILCPQATENDWHHVMDIIEEADTLLPIDCVRFDQISKDDPLKLNIIRDRKILYQRGKAFMDKSLWKDYFDNLGKALARLGEALEHPELATADILQDAAIHRFEFSIELYWKVLKKILSYEKIESTTPRDVLRKAYQFKLIDDEDQWLSMLDDRNNTSHVYKQEDAKRVFENIKSHFPIMAKTYTNLKEKYA